MDKKSELKAAAARLLYNSNRSTSDYDMLIDFIDSHFDNQPQDGWIPCKTESPKKSGRYWVTFLWSSIPCTKVGYYNADEKKWTRSSYDPIAWKPYTLPEPYKEIE